MLLGKTQIKQRALILSLVYLLLSGFMMVGEQQGHALEHVRRARNTVRHPSLICAWMCAASTSIHSANPNLRQRLNASFEDLVVSAEPFPSHLSVFYFHGRSPPVGLA
jgi:hypothetical protein